MSHERRERYRRVVAHNDVDVISQNGLRVNVHLATPSGLKHCGDNIIDVCGANRPLPTPRMPRDVRVQATGFVRSPFPHVPPDRVG